MTAMTILTHNVFWFQGVPFAGDEPGEPDGEIVNQLCVIYQQIGADVICLQEIQSRAAFDVVAERMGMDGCYCPGGSLVQYGGAVLWRSGCGRVIDDSRAASPVPQRMWQIVEIGGLRLCNIHLPSARQLGAERAAAQRLAESQDAVGWCDMRPDVIAGDFNEPPGGPTGQWLARQGYVDAVATGQVTRLHKGRLDYIWIKASIISDHLHRSAADWEQLACDHAGKEALSDHLPLWIVLDA